MRKIILTLIMCLCFGFVCAEIDKTKTSFISDFIELYSEDMDENSIACKCWFQINCVSNGNAKDEIICFDLSSCDADKMIVEYTSTLKIVNKEGNITDSLEMKFTQGSRDFELNGYCNTEETHRIVYFKLKKISCIDKQLCFFLSSKTNGFFIYLNGKEKEMKEKYYNVNKEYNITKEARDNESSFIRKKIINRKK